MHRAGVAALRAVGAEAALEGHLDRRADADGVGAAGDGLGDVLGHRDPAAHDQGHAVANPALDEPQVHRADPFAGVPAGPGGQHALKWT